MKQKLIDIFNSMKIGNKILSIMLITSMGALLTIVTISYSEMLHLSRYSENANMQLGVTVSKESEDALLGQANMFLKKLAVEQAASSDATLSKVQSELLSAKGYLENVYANPASFNSHSLPRPDETVADVPSAKAFVVGGGEATGAAAADMAILSNAEYAFSSIFKNDDVIWNIYLGTESGVSYRYSKSNKYNKDYDPRQREWYKKAMESPEKIIWLDTYLDSFGRTCVTCATTFKGSDGNVAGVIATDIIMETMTKDVINTKIGENGYAFLLDSNNKYIAHPNYMDKDFIKDARNGEKSESWQKLLDSMSTEDNAINIADIGGEKHYVAYSKMPTTGWIFCIAVPIEEVIQPALETKAKIDTYADKSVEYITDTLSSVLTRFIILFAICALLFVMFSFILSKFITKPIINLTEQVKQIGGGDLDTRVNISGNDEVAELGTAFNNMTEQLKEYIHNITETTKEREKIQADLNTAKHIQLSALPKMTAIMPFPDEVDFYAYMDTAKEVGGDFYDFFRIGNDYMAFVIADVSGKGVPAALFMMTSKSIIKNQAHYSISPSEILSTANNSLCENNDADMFVTVWMGILNLHTGEVVATNAGHKPPAICRKNGKFELYKDKHGIMVAAMPDVKYKEYRFTLEEGDTMFLSTDGVEEATNAQEELFGNERMLMALDKNIEKSPKEIVTGVREAIDEFVENAPQFDDITMMCIRYKGNK